MPSTGAAPTRAPASVQTLGNYVIYFGKDQDTIPSESQELTKLREIATAFQHKYSEARLVGHASTEGNPTYNVDLSH